MNHSVKVLLFLVAITLVAMIVPAKSLPTLDNGGKKKPLHPSTPPQPAATTEKEKLEENGGYYYYEDKNDTYYYNEHEDTEKTDEGSTDSTDLDHTKKEDDYVDQEEEYDSKKKTEYNEDEIEEIDEEDAGNKKKEHEEEYDYYEDVLQDSKKKHHDGPTTESEGGKSCPLPYCADPKLDEDGCERCDNSSCMFRGCVSYGAFFPSWKPDPCTFCVCLDGQEECTTIDCGEEPNCHGYPLVTKHGQCCPECDYGIPKDECGLIPYKPQSLYVSLGYYSCQTDVLTHKCDKQYVYNSEEDAYYRCTETEGVHQIEMSDKCESSIHSVTYTDVKACEGQKVDISELPQDIPIYDGTPDHCAFYVE